MKAGEDRLEAYRDRPSAVTGVTDLMLLAQVRSTLALERIAAALEQWERERDAAAYRAEVLAEKRERFA